MLVIDHPQKPGDKLLILSMDEATEEFTAVMREADQIFESTGGSTRHYMRDVFLPLLEKAGFVICRTRESGKGVTAPTDEELSKASQVYFKPSIKPEGEKQFTKYTNHGIQEYPLTPQEATLGTRPKFPMGDETGLPTGNKDYDKMMVEQSEKMLRDMDDIAEKLNWDTKMEDTFGHPSPEQVEAWKRDMEAPPKTTDNGKS